MDKKAYTSAAAVMGAGCLWGSMGIFVRRFEGLEIASMNIVSIRSVLTAVILFAVLLIKDRRLLKIRLNDLWIFIGCGLASLVFFNFCYFKAITVMPLSSAAILLYTSPVFVMLMSAILFKEKITGRKIIAVILSVIGLSLVTGVVGSGGRIGLTGLLYGLGSAFGYALYSIFTRFAIKRGYPTLTVTFYPFVFAAIGSALLAEPAKIVDMYAERPSMILFSLVFAAAVSVIPYFLYSWGLKGLENSSAAVIASIEPVAASVFGIALFGEKLSLPAAMGILLVLCGIFLSSKKSEPTDE